MTIADRCKGWFIVWREGMVLSMGKCLMCQKNSLCEKTLRAQGVCLFGEFMCRGKGAVRADVPPRFCASKIFRSPTPHPHKHLLLPLPATYPDPHPQRSLSLTPTLTYPQASTSFFPKVTSLVTLMIESLQYILFKVYVTPTTTVNS